MSTLAFTQVEFKAALGHFASGIVVVTGTDGARPRGLACQSFFSVSLDPPLVAVSVANSSTSWQAIERTGAFGVNVLDADQVDLCRRFGRPGADKFAGLDWAAGITGAPRLSGTLAWIDCIIEAAHPAGDHALVVGRVQEVSFNAGRPLLFYRGRFGELHPHAAHTLDTNLEHLLTGLRQGWG